MMRRILAPLVLLSALVAPVAALEIKSDPRPGATPSITAAGEIAINRADGKLFYRRGDGSLGTSTLLNALPSGRRAVEQGQSDDQTVAGRPLSGFIKGDGGKTTLTPDAITGDASGTTVTPTGGTSGTLKNLLGDLSGLFYYVPTITAKVKLADLLDVPISPKWWGANCDGTAIDTDAINSALSALNDRRLLRFPAGVCKFASTLFFPMYRRGIEGAGANATVLLYAGASTNIDLIQVGNSGASAGPGDIRGFTVQSDTVMTAGAAIHAKTSAFVNFDSVNVLGKRYSAPGTKALYNGVYFDEIDYTRFTNFQATDVIYDCVQVSGKGINQPNPQFDLYMSHGKIGGCGNSGFHIGGGMDNVHADFIMNTYPGTFGVLIDNALSNYANQSIFFGPNFNVEYASANGYYINDTLASPTTNGSITIGGPVLLTQGGSDGIKIQNYPNGFINISSPFIHDNTGCAVLVLDGSVYLSISPSTVIFRNYCGINTVPNYNRLLSTGVVTANTGYNYAANVKGGYSGNAPGSLSASVTPAASPWAYSATAAGSLVLSGGTVSSVTIARNGGAAFPAGVTAGAIPVRAGDTITVTYSAAPTANFLPQ